MDKIFSFLQENIKEGCSYMLKYLDPFDFVTLEQYDS
ncbi:unnamed protein product [Choristocarpus tenellus]